MRTAVGGHHRPGNFRQKPPRWERAGENKKKKQGNQFGQSRVFGSRSGKMSQRGWQEKSFRALWSVVGTRFGQR